MKNDGVQMNRREFMGTVGLGAAALTASKANRAFAMGSRVLGANDRIRIGLIGAGDRGQEDLKSALRQPNVECVAVADVYSRRCDQVKAFVPGVEAYDDPMRLLERTDIDGVINATPQHCMRSIFWRRWLPGKISTRRRPSPGTFLTLWHAAMRLKHRSRLSRSACRTRAPAK